MNKKFILFVFLIIGLCLTLTKNTFASENYTEYIYVDIKGEVESPGVYRVSSYTRVFQVIQLAGGLTIDAYTRNVNLSKKIIDEEIIYIPSYVDSYLDNSSNELININTASKELLMTLPHIGEVTASNIIAYRENVQPFRNIIDIMNVSGIGEATYNEIKTLITV